MKTFVAWDKTNS